MTSNYTAIVQQNNGWWIGWIEEVPGVNAQERTKEELMSSLREALKEALEFNREDARASAQVGYTEELVTVKLDSKAGKKLKPLETNLGM